MYGGQALDAVLVYLEPRRPSQDRRKADFPSHRFAAKEVLIDFFTFAVDLLVKRPQRNMTIRTSNAQVKRRAETENCDLRDAVAGVLACRE